MKFTVRNLSGRKFGRLTVLRFAGFAKGSRALWECRCKCGTVKIVRGNNLQRSKSCGCFNPGNTTHGMKRSREYQTWHAMKSRCLRASDPAFRNYGARGIKVCSRWKNSFENFLKDMGPRPEGLIIDRRNNNGHYTPSNCRWVTYAQSNRNKRPKSKHRRPRRVTKRRTGEKVEACN